MILKILGWIWILAGILLLALPQAAKRNTPQMANKIIKEILFVVLLALSILLTAFTYRKPGFWGRVVLIAGIIDFIKAFLIFRLKEGGRIISWAAKQSTGVYQLAGVYKILIGAVILSL